MSALWARKECGWSPEMLLRRSAARSSRREVSVLRAHVEVVGVGVVEAGGHVLPVVGQRGRDLLLGGDGHQAVLRQQLQQLAETVHRQQLGDVGAVVLVADRCDLRELAVLGGELCRRGDLHAVGLLQRALGEGGEVGEPLDLDVEQLAAHSPLLGRGVEVEDVAAHGELAALLDLVDALVAAGHELGGGLLEVEQLALLDGEAVRAQRGVGHLLRQRHRRGHHHGALSLEQRVQRGDPQAHQVGRRGQVRLVLHPAGRVEAHLTGAEEGAQVRRQVAGRAVVAGHHQGGPGRLGVDQRGEQERPQAGGHEGTLRLGLGGLAEGADGVVGADVVE